MALRRTILSLTRDGSVLLEREELLQNTMTWVAGMNVPEASCWFSLKNERQIATSAGLLLHRIMKHVRPERPDDTPPAFCAVCLGRVELAPFNFPWPFWGLVVPEWLPTPELEP